MVKNCYRSGEVLVSLDYLRGDISLEEADKLKTVLAFHQFTFSQVM